jgi:adenylyl-sulfate kinase
MPMCVGICVLLAIVYVLSRTGMDPSQQQQLIQQQIPHNALRSDPINNAAAAAAATHVPVAAATTNSNSNSYAYNYNNSPATTPPVSTIATTTATASYVPPTENNAIISAANPQDAASAAANANAAHCDCPTAAASTESDVELMGRLRQQALANTPPHIIECAAAEAGESQKACHLPKKQRFAALGQKGATLWMTGCSGAGKTTIATALEDLLVQRYGKHVYRLDGDNLRTGLNRDLGFSEWDRAESVRRTGELATLFSDAGVITLVGLISPYRQDRDEVRQRHEEQGIPFYEVFLDVPMEELFSRDPKGQYARVKSGELKHFTCIDDPYEEPLRPEIVLKTHECEYYTIYYICI